MKTKSKAIIITFTLNSTSLANYFISLSYEFVRRGYIVIIITPGCRENKVSKKTNPAIYTWPSYRPTHIQDAFFLIGILRLYKPVMILSNFSSVNISLIVSYLMGVPLRFATYLTAQNRYLKEYKYSKIKSKLQNIRKTVVYKFASKILPISKAMASEVEIAFHVPPKKIRYFYTAIEEKERNFIVDTYPQRKLVCVGGLTFGKGQDVLIKAMQVIVRRFPEITLLLLGDGERKCALVDLVSDLELSNFIKFIGNVPREQVFSYMQGAQAVIVPSRFDAFPIVIIEAMSLGIPIIASNVGGISEIVRDGIDGFLVHPDNVGMLALKITDLLNNSDLQYSMQKNVREQFLKNFELRKVVRDNADWFESEINAIGTPSKQISHE